MHYAKFVNSVYVYQQTNKFIEVALHLKIPVLLLETWCNYQLKQITYWFCFRYEAPCYTSNQHQRSIYLSKISGTRNECVCAFLKIFLLKLNHYRMWLYIYIITSLHILFETTYKINPLKYDSFVNIWFLQRLFLLSFHILFFVVCFVVERERARERERERVQQERERERKREREGWGGEYLISSKKTWEPKTFLWRTPTHKQCWLQG